MKFNWQAACKAGCGNLVAINSPQEQAFIESKTTAGGELINIALNGQKIKDF